MIKTLGKRMGMNFDPSAIEYLYRQYGGHPLLTRIACSLIHQAETDAGSQRPVTLTRSALVTSQKRRDGELSFYCEHVVAELRQFYEDEYAMLELLACKELSDFTELANNGVAVNHLREYGLLTEIDGVPRVAIPVIEAYVGGRAGNSYEVPVNTRPLWLARRMAKLIRDMRSLEQRIRASKRPLLFGPTSFPEADRLEKAPLALSEDDFGTFINLTNRCFVEPIEKHGQLVGNNRYFWDLKTEYPVLFDALDRVKTYRNNAVHILLKPEVEEKFARFIREDLDGMSPTQHPDLWFTLQHRILDKLFLAIQVESARLV